jgi:very-short-patch-repair endonuclease
MGRTRHLREVGVHFRRQAPFENYIVDQACHCYRLIIEVDGAQHGDDPVQVAHDRKRTRFLESRGYRVLRFWNSEVLNNTPGVVETILMAIEEQRQKLMLPPLREPPLIPPKKTPRSRQSR